jgi:hypothetical protein
VLIGDDPGAREAAAEFGTDWVPDVARTEFGTPFLDAVFAAAEERARFDVLCYVNADIIFPTTFGAAIQAVAESLRRFLVVGHSWNVDVHEYLAGDREWTEALARRALAEGQRRISYAMDFFGFRRATLGRIPPFVVGRPGWDNWMVYRARLRAMPVVDVSDAVVAVHQRHDYSHVPAATGPKWAGPETEHNWQFVAHQQQKFSLADATHRLVPGAPHPVRIPTAGLVRRVRRALRPLAATRAGHAARTLVGSDPWAEDAERRRRARGTMTP